MRSWRGWPPRGRPWSWPPTTPPGRSDPAGASCGSRPPIDPDPGGPKVGVRARNTRNCLTLPERTPIVYRARELRRSPRVSPRFAELFIEPPPTFPSGSGVRSVTRRRHDTNSSRATWWSHHGDSVGMVRGPDWSASTRRRAFVATIIPWLRTSAHHSRRFFQERKGGSTQLEYAATARGRVRPGLLGGAGHELRNLARITLGRSSHCPNALRMEVVR
jgi:hypothetical protein